MRDAARQVPCTGRAVTPSSEQLLTWARVQAQEDRASDKAAAEMEKLRTQLEEAERKAKSLEDMQRQAAAMQVSSAASIPMSWTVCFDSFCSSTYQVLRGALRKRIW